MEDALSGTEYNIYSFALMFRLRATNAFLHISVLLWESMHSVRGAWLYRVLQSGCQQTPIDSQLNSEL